MLEVTANLMFSPYQGFINEHDFLINIFVTDMMKKKKVDFKVWKLP